MCRECGCDPHHHGEGRERWSEHRISRRFLTKAEKVEKLETYAEELRKELAAVEEQIKELRS